MTPVAASDAMATLQAPLLISFGSNLDPLENLTQGIGALHRRLGVAAISTVYRTRPLGDSHGPDFLNGALRLASFPASPLEMKRILRQVEEERGRVRLPDRNAPRTLDLDVALAGALVFRHPSLSIPDPDIMDRWFLGYALAQLAGTWIHPVAGLSLATLQARFHPADEEIVPDPEASRLLQSILTSSAP